MKRLIEGLAGKYAAVCRKVYGLMAGNTLGIMFVFGGLLLAVGLAESSHAINTNVGTGGASFQGDERIRQAGEAILGGLVEGSFGALVMIIAGLIAIVSAALGAYRAALAALVVAVGAFILRAIVSLFFGDVIDPTT